MRVPLVIATPLLALVLLAPSGAPASAAPVDTVETDGWSWQVLDGETALLGLVTAPPTPSIGALTVSATTPTLRAPEFPALFSFFGGGTWTYSSVAISQPVADGVATVTADYTGPGGTVDVSVVLDGGSAEYTMTLPTGLTNLIGIDYDPAPSGYSSGEVITETTDTGSASQLGGWLSGSVSHHSFAWGLDQLPFDPNPNWAVFLLSTTAPIGADLGETLQPTGTVAGLTRALIFADGPAGISTPADTWIARVSLVGGVGCAVEPSSLQALAEALETAVAAGSTADETGCVTAPPVNGSVGTPLDKTVVLELDPAAAGSAWWTARDTLELITGALPAGLNAELVVVAGEPRVRIYGTPSSASTSTVPFALGGESTAPGTDLIDAVAGELRVDIDPALAVTGAHHVAPIGAGALALVAIGLTAVVVARRQRVRLS